MRSIHTKKKQVFFNTCFKYNTQTSERTSFMTITLFNFILKCLLRMTASYAFTHPRINIQLYPCICGQGVDALWLLQGPVHTRCRGSSEGQG